MKNYDQQITDLSSKNEDLQQQINELSKTVSALRSLHKEKFLPGEPVKYSNGDFLVVSSGGGFVVLRSQPSIYQLFGLARNSENIAVREELVSKA